MKHPEDVQVTIEILGIYDGYSVIVYKDGTVENRWANEDGTGPREGYERLYLATQEYIERYLTNDET